MSPPTCVLFDLGGVVFRYGPEARLRAFARATGLAPEEVDRRLFRSGFSTACDRGAHQGVAMFEEATRLLASRMSLASFIDLWLTAFVPDDELASFRPETSVWCMDAPAFSALPEAQPQARQGKWELLQTVFAKASKEIAMDGNFRTRTS